MKEFLTNLLHSAGLAWWVEIVTDNPHCTYYFGPFLDENDAYESKAGYIEDLEAEGSKVVELTIKRCKPSNLTIDVDLGERIDRKTTPALSGQLS